MEDSLCKLIPLNDIGVSCFRVYKSVTVEVNNLSYEPHHEKTIMRKLAS